MSFLIDPPLLVASGVAYAKADGPRPKAAGLTTIGVFWLAAAAFFRDHAATRPVTRAFRSRDGQDFMINSGVLRIRYRPRSAGTWAASLLVLATYPLWLWLGWMLGRG